MARSRPTQEYQIIRYLRCNIIPVPGTILTVELYNQENHRRLLALELLVRALLYMWTVESGDTSPRPTASTSGTFAFRNQSTNETNYTNHYNQLTKPTFQLQPKMSVEGLRI